LKLSVKPQINESDYVRLVITETIEEIASQDAVLGPTTSKRSAKTTVVAKDQQTVVIGGIMQDRVVESVSKTPILGDIPLLGNLFRQQSRRKVKTNLLLFLTPYIIRDSSDFARIFERKMKERQQFVEQFYGASTGYDVAIDFARKPGPIARITQILNREMNKVENGGPGNPGEKVIVPGGSQSLVPSVPGPIPPTSSSSTSEPVPVPVPASTVPPPAATEPGPGGLPAPPPPVPVKEPSPTTLKVQPGTELR
jgi:general secretion pathway protein D